LALHEVRFAQANEFKTGAIFLISLVFFEGCLDDEKVSQERNFSGLSEQAVKSGLVMVW